LVRQIAEITFELSDIAEFFELTAIERVEAEACCLA
jgi:hypothetical protein